MDGEEMNEQGQIENPELVTDSEPETPIVPVTELNSRIVALEEKIKEIVVHLNSRLGSRIGG
jgi:uncharacterized small protein (DUF1192 family)